MTGVTSLNAGPSMTVQPTTAAPEATSGSSFVQAQHKQGPTSIKPSPTGSLGAAEKPGLTLKQVSAKPNFTSDSVRAAAVAAGARIATPSDAATLLKAAQAKNAVRIMPGGASIKSSMSGGVSTHMDVQHSLHHKSTGFGGSSLTTYPAAASTIRPSALKTPSPQIQRAQPSVTAQSMISSKQEKGLSSSQEVKSSKGIEVFVRRGVPKIVKEDGTCTTKKPIEEDKDKKMVPKKESELPTQVSVRAINNTPEAESGTGAEAVHDNLAEDCRNVSDMKHTDGPVKGGEDQPVAKETSQEQSTNEKTDSTSTKENGCGEKVEV